MAVLGSFVDRVANAFTLAGPTTGIAAPLFQTTPHSLGAAPDYIVPVLASYGPALAPGFVGAGIEVPAVGGLRGNASLNTVFAGVPTGATISGTLSVDVVAVTVWSGAR